MDLATVKAKVKAWEATFRADRARAPTKEDIKNDSSNIAELYATYRKLSKALPKSRDIKDSKHSSKAIQLSASCSQTTPEASRVRNGSPITPSSRRLFDLRDAGSSKRTAGSETPGRDSKRLKPGYLGPVHDSNPFRTPQKDSLSTTSPFSAKSDAQIQFIHAGSPRRLREVLEANSLKKSREHNVTPRTKARKRLAGELDDSPFRIRKRRGTRSLPVIEDKENKVGPGDDDEIEETPVKGAAFEILGDTLSKPRDLLPIFQKARSVPAAATSTAPQTSFRLSPPPHGEPNILHANSSGAEFGSRRSPEPNLSTLPADSAPIVSRIGYQDRARVVALSEEDDAESHKRLVRITGTRRPAIGGQWSDDDLADHPKPKQTRNEDGVGGVESGVGDLGPYEDLLETRSLASLSIRSPAMRKGERLADLRVRALLDPTSAAATALRAMTKGQDVFVSGEGFESGVDDGFSGTSEIGSGDDDWESDAEGWKAVVSDEDW